MKKVWITMLGLLLASSTLFAQKEFNGTIKFSTKMMGEQADQFAAFAPTGMTYTFRKGDARVEIVGGMAAAMMGPIVVKGKEGVSYMIKDAEQAAYKFENDDAEEVDEKLPEVTKMDETIKILGYKCQKYKVVFTEGEGEDAQEVTSYMWITDEIQPQRAKSKGKDRTSKLFLAGINGMALKRMTSMDVMGMSITQIETATEIDDSEPDAKLFEIPKNYEIKDGAELMNGMMMGQ